MKRIDVKQGSWEWLCARAGIPTASEFDALVSPLWKKRDGETPKTYLCTKLAERWRGRPLESFSSGAMQQGQLTESEAVGWYELMSGETIERVGFITTDDGKIGCSPDGILEDGGIEIKCPEPHTHVKYLLGGELPADYRAQVHGSMLVTGASWWKFLSYCRDFPPLLIVVERDEQAQAVLREVLDAFNDRLDAAYAELVERNGGPSPRPKPAQERLREFWESQGELKETA